MVIDEVNTKLGKAYEDEDGKWIEQITFLKVNHTLGQISEVKLVDWMGREMDKADLYQMAGVSIRIISRRAIS